MSAGSLHPFDKFLRDQLNEDQQKAVAVPEGVLLVVAGAGSGKTRIITARIANLIMKQQVAPASIVALTFTNKAAQEMQQRIISFIGKMPEMPFIGTFHAYCLRFLKRYHDLLSVPFFSILDEDDQLKMINGIIKRHGLNKKVTAKQFSYQISLLKNQSTNPESAPLLTYDQWLADLFKAYEKEKQESKCLDFDDLLLETVRLIKKNDEIRQKLHDSIAHILVDEYQDTNVVQHELLKLLALKEKKKLSVASLCVVGDEDQSIYSWRGATVANILNFKRDFPEAQFIKVEQNYRSVNQILEVANAVISHNENRNAKNLWSTRQGKDRVYLCNCVSEYQEADMVSCFIKKLIAKQKDQRIAVLYRAHYQSRTIEEALIKIGIPYTIIGGIQFYDRREIKDLLAYLRLACNPYDRTSFFRIINAPARGLGESFEELFYDRWHQEPLLTFADIAQLLIKEGELTHKKKAALGSFVTLVQSIKPSDKPSLALEAIISQTQYIPYIRETFDTQEADTKSENIKELLYAMKHFEGQEVNTVAAFLDEVALLQEKIAIAKQEKSSPVVLMTLHAAKGLEFENVAIIGLNEEVLPNSRSLADPEAIEEERRLFYVGVTRARERLLLTHARCRYTFGQMSDSLPSRFIREIPSHLVNKQEIAYAAPAQIEIIFDNWLGIDQHKRSGGLLTFGGGQKPARAEASPEINADEWKKYQPVEHPQFGIGTIQDVERKRDGKLYITAKFKHATKKIESTFLKRL